MSYLVPRELETERLLLRGFRDADWRELHEYYADEIATRFTFGHALTQGDTWRVMAGMVGHWELRGYGPYAVESKSGGEVLGVVGFWYPLDWPEPEIKWGLARRHWGHGYASEAARAVQQARREHQPELPLISMIHPGNTASLSVAVAIGASFDRESDYLGDPVHIYRHPS